MPLTRKISSILLASQRTGSYEVSQTADSGVAVTTRDESHCDINNNDIDDENNNDTQFGIGLAPSDRYTKSLYTVTNDDDAINKPTDVNNDYDQTLTLRHRLSSNARKFLSLRPKSKHNSTNSRSSLSSGCSSLESSTGSGQHNINRNNSNHHHNYNFASSNNKATYSPLDAQLKHDITINNLDQQPQQLKLKHMTNSCKSTRNIHRLKCNKQDGVTLCTLGVGTTFGASVMPGKSHSVSVVTSDDCTLLRVRRADFQEIFNEQSHLIDNVESSPFNSFTSLNRMSNTNSGHNNNNNITYAIGGTINSTYALGNSTVTRKRSSNSGGILPAGKSAELSNNDTTQVAGKLVDSNNNNNNNNNSGEPILEPNSSDTYTNNAKLQTQQQQSQQYQNQLAPNPASGIRGLANGLAPGGSGCGSQSPAPLKFGGQSHSTCDLEADEEQDEEALDDLNLNLKHLDVNELSGHLTRIGWVLRTLILNQRPQMIQNRRVYPHQMHRHKKLQQQQQLLQKQQLQNMQLQQQQLQQQQQQQLQLQQQQSNSKQKPFKQLVFSGSNQTGSGQQQQHQQVASAKSAGRKVANYVASSFMRSNNKTSQQQQPQATSNNSSNRSSGGQVVSLFSSNSFDSNTPPTSGHHSSTRSKLLSMSNSINPSGNGNNTTNNSSAINASTISTTTCCPSTCEPVMFKNSMIGSEMVDYLVDLSQVNTNAARFVTSRLQAISMWQVLIEQGVVLAFSESLSRSNRNLDGDTYEHNKVGGAHRTNSTKRSSVQNPNQSQQTCGQFQFCDDPQAYYKFWFDQMADNSNESSGSEQFLQQQQVVGNEAEMVAASESLWWALKILSKLAPDALFRLILAKLPHERSFEEIDIVCEELLHLKALSHLTNSVKRELAACVTSEHHSKQNTVIFNQGDAGDSWYIILRGSVNVVIVGKGVVCTLHEGDDFGKLALVNDAPRAATIVTNEPNCYFLRVDKHNFNTILRDVEANTVRLKEHGKEVLILQRVPVKEPAAASGGQSNASGEVTLESGANNSEPHNSSGNSGNATATTFTTATTANIATTTNTDSAVQLSGLPSGSQSLSSAGGVANNQSQATSSGGGQQSQQQQALKYMVMAGTSEKMLEHLLETRIDGQTQIGPLLMSSKEGLQQHDQVSAYIQCHGDNFLEDFIITHKIFMPTSSLCNELLKQYQCQAKAASLTGCGAGVKSGNQVANGKTASADTSNQQHDHSANQLDDEYLVAKKRRVVKFVRCWLLITRQHFFQQQQIQSFLTTLHQKVKQDAIRFPSLQPELKVVARILELHLEESLESRHRGVQRWIDDIYGNILPIRRHSGQWELSATASPLATELFLASLHRRRFEHKLSSPIQPEDELVFRVYCADHSFTTLKTRIDEKAAEIKLMAAKKLNLQDKELILVHVKSNGERIIFNDSEFSVSTNLSVNGRIFVCPLDHIDAISPLPEQDPFQEVYQGLVGSTPNSNNPQLQIAIDSQQTGGGSMSSDPTQQLNNNQLADQQQQQQVINSHLLNSTPTNYADIKTQMSLSVGRLEEFSSRDIAYCLTQLAWSLLKNVHEFELVYCVLGRHNFKQVTANLNVFLRHFNEIQYWVVTQICLTTSLSKRVQILRKFIKIAAHCKELQNLNAFFAIIMGLSNMAVARLTQTWEKLPSKLKRTFSQFESQIDPSRNHRRYRIFISKMEPPIIPFMPLLIKDMTFAHEGNKTYLENGLINFEKMQMVAQTLRTIRYCKSRPMKLDQSVCKFKGSIRSIELFFRDLKIIDNQRTLTQMSHQLEHRKT